MALNVNTSVVDLMKSKGMDSTIGNRTTLAGQYGIGGYQGTADQNVQLMNYIRNGGPTQAAPTPAPAPATPQPTVQAPATPTPTAPAPAAPSSPVDQIFDRQKEAQLAQLKLSRDKAIGEINAQKEKVAPEYYKARNQSDVVSMQNVQRLREIMASQGLTASGENVTANVAMNNSRQAALNELNTQERGIMNDFERQITSINNPQEETALIAALEAQRSQALYEDGWKNKQFDYQAGRDGVADSQWGAQFGYQVSRDKVADNQWGAQFGYQRERDSVADNQWGAQLAFQKEQFGSEQAWREHTFNNMSASEKASLEWSKSQYGEDAAWRMYELNYSGELAKGQYQAELGAYGSELDFLP